MQKRQQGKLTDDFQSTILLYWNINSNKMTIQELIGLLANYPPGMRVVVRGYEDGYNDIDTIKEVSIILNANEEWYYGTHADSRDDSSVQALLLAGENRNGEEELNR